MNGFSWVDGFVEINESLSEMIKYLANEPSVGLFYVQQHAHNSVPNLITHNNNITQKSRAANLHAQDLDDSVTMVKSMKHHGPRIVDGMIKNINDSLFLISSKHARKGTLSNTRSESGSYLSNVYASAKERASKIKWPQLESIERTRSGEKSFPFPCPPENVLSHNVHEVMGDGSSSKLLSEMENYEAFKADKEAKLKEWLDGKGGNVD